MVEREKEMQEWNEQRLPKVLAGYSGGRLPGRSTKEKGREEGGLQVKVSVDDGAKEAAQRSIGQSVMRSWDCSQIENEEEEVSWREGDQMAAQWDE